MIRKATIGLLFLLLGSTAALPTEASPSYMFQTVLLLGSSEGSSDLSGIPANVAGALEDVAQFLPYKSYRMIDTSIIRSAVEARGRLTGLSGQEFELEFRFQDVDADSLFVKGFSIDTLVPEAQDRVVTEGKKTKLEHQPPRWVRKSVIATSFTVEIGETIVVGTSKLNGSGQALIVLFTAVR